MKPHRPRGATLSQSMAKLRERNESGNKPAPAIPAATPQRKRKFHVGQVVHRLGYDDYARITKLGVEWVTFQDSRGARIQYLRPLTKCEAA